MEANILNFGAVADGVTLNTEAIQKAIDTVAEAGGGRVTVPAGTFVTGTIWLKSHIELHLESGAVLKASTSLEDYNSEDAYRQNWSCLDEGWVGKHLIIAVEERDIAITGKGIINGMGESFFAQGPNPLSTGYAWRYGIVFSKEGTVRPGQTIAIIQSEDITVRDVSIIDSPSWCFYVHGCENVTISGVRVKNCPWHANTDGIDIDACKNVTVSDCIIDTGDDAIAIRCVGYRIREDLEVCENITVTNCVFSSRSCGVRISVGKGTIRNVTMSNIVFKESSPAILIASAYMNRGNISADNLYFSNIIADDVGRVITINESNGCTIKNIAFSNVRARAMCQCKVTAEEAGNISNILFRDVDLELSKAHFPHGDNNHVERGKYAVELNGVDGMRLENVRVTFAEDVDMELYGETNSTDITKNNCNF